MKKTGTRAKKKKKKTTKLKVVQIPITAFYQLVWWPDASQLVPTYNQMAMTLELISIYSSNKKSFPEEAAKHLEKWLTDNSIPKFQKTMLEAEHHQDLLDDQAAEWIEDQMMYKPVKRRMDN